MAAIFRGFLSSAVISAVLFYAAGFFYLNTPEMAQWGGWWRVPTAVAVGVLLAIMIDRLTEYFTGYTREACPGYQESCGHRPGDFDPTGHFRWL